MVAGVEPDFWAIVCSCLSFFSDHSRVDRIMVPSWGATRLIDLIGVLLGLVLGLHLPKEQE